MATTFGSDTRRVNLDDPYSGIITGGVTGGFTGGFGHTPKTTKVLPENGTLIVDDFSISAKELKVCLSVLRKIAMEEMPEEFI